MLRNLDDLLDAVKTRHGIKSDYKLAKLTGKTNNTIANYRHGRSRPDDNTLTEFANMAGIEGAQVEMLALRFHMDRLTSEASRDLWNGILHRLNYEKYCN